MLIKKPKPQAPLSALLAPSRALLACSVLGLVSAPSLFAQNPAPPAAPATAVAPATLIRLSNEAEAAFGAKDYKLAIEKTQELLRLVGPNTQIPIEVFHFNIGLAYLLDQKYPEAETAFNDFLKKYPKGEYTSRAYLGIARAFIEQKSEEKSNLSIDALKVAANDPKLRSEAGLLLGQVYTDLDQNDEALKVFKSLMGSDIRTPQQTNAAVEVVGLLADAGKVEDLIAYLDRLKNQAGIRDAMAWYVSQLIVRAEQLIGLSSHETALALLRAVPPRSQIIEIQTNSLNAQRQDVQILENRVKAEKDKPLDQRSSAAEILNEMKPAIEISEKALKTFEEKENLDAIVIMLRGRCLFGMARDEEALQCFRTIRTKYAKSSEAKSAAHGEIVILSRLKNIVDVKARCDDYLRKYPDAENAEQIATLAGDVLVQEGNWKEVTTFYRDLESKFPNSPNLDRFIFLQGVAYFQDNNFKEAVPFFKKFIEKYPESANKETAYYYIALCHFQANEYKETLVACKQYISSYPEGTYAGDIRYRLAFIDSNDKTQDLSDKIINDITTFLEQRPSDPIAGSMLCLLADTYKKKKSDRADVLGRYQKSALDAYKKAVSSGAEESVVQYALDSATKILQENKDWAGIATLHSEILNTRPDSSLALVSASWVAKMKTREGKTAEAIEGKTAEAVEILATALKSRIGDPTNEQVEFLLDEIVKTLIPRKKPADIDVNAVDATLVALLNKSIEGQENGTTNARLYYARARLALLLKRPDIHDTHLKGIATINAADPTVLSPSLLAASGDILLKIGQLDEAEGMYKRLVERHKEGMFADAGPVGLGNIALARKNPAEALRIFNESLEKQGLSRFKEANLGRLQAMAALGQLDEAEKFAVEIVGDKNFRGEISGRVSLLRGTVAREKAKKATADAAKNELLNQAVAIYNRVITTHKNVPDVCAEAYWQAYEASMELGKKEDADKFLMLLANEPKLKGTERAKKANTLVTK